MKIFELLPFQTFILVFHYLIKGDFAADVSEIEEETEVASTSQANEEKCKCGRSNIAELLNENIKDNRQDTIGGIKLIYRVDGQIGIGGFAMIYHAYIPDERKCVPLKISKSNGSINSIRREVDVLKYFAKSVNEDQKNHIIKMLGHEEREDRGGQVIYLILELAGMDLKEYFHQRIKDKGGIVGERSHEELLIKIVKGAAQALEQFHKHGIHGDIKHENFVFSLDQSLDETVIECKLIDFNFSVLRHVKDLKHPIKEKRTSEIISAPEIRRNKVAKVTQKADIWAFGLMVHRLYINENFIDIDDVYAKMKAFQLNPNYNTVLDRVIKACTRKNKNERPNMGKILNFLNGDLKQFEYERRRERRLRPRKWGACLGFCRRN